MMITKLKWIIEMASIDDDKIVFPSRTRLITSYHQTEAIWIFFALSSPLTAVTTRVAFEISRLLFFPSFSYSLSFVSA